MRILNSLYVYLLLTLAFIGGCASNANFANTKADSDWQLSGKIGLVYPEANCGGEDCHNRSDQGSIVWQQRNQAYAIKLSDPFGRVVMTVTGNDQQLLAQSPNQAPIQSTPDQFIATLANDSSNPGLSALSPRLLSHWMTGRPAPQFSVTQKGDAEFEQAGYKVRATQWRQTPVGKMPSLILVVKDKFKLRLVVREWTKLTPTQ